MAHDAAGTTGSASGAQAPPAHVEQPRAVRADQRTVARRRLRGPSDSAAHSRSTMNGERRTTNGGRQRALLTFAVRRSAFAVLCVRRSAVRSVLRSAVFAQEPAFKSGSSELVVLPVVVTDKQGRYVSDLPARALHRLRQRPARADRALHQRRHAGHRRPDHRRQRQHAAEDRRGDRRVARVRALEQPAGRAVRGPLQRRRAGRDARSAVSARRRPGGARGRGQRRFAPTAAPRSTTA